MVEYGRFVDEPISKKSVLNIINQIDEPQKVVIPKVVAEWIERCKESKDTLYHALQDNDDVNDWLDRDDNEDLFARAWVNGYEAEKEKLYTVEIPNPQKVGEDAYTLMKNSFEDVVITRKVGHDWKNKKDTN